MIPTALLEEAKAAHVGAHRHYHTWPHALAVLQHVRATGPWEDPVAAELAAVLHDAIYAPQRHDNEARSADLARALLATHGLAAHAEAVTAHILATARHGQLTRADVSADTARFLDCDVAVLAAPPAVFDAYEAGVRAEYTSFLAPEIYAAGRSSFLATMLAKERIFLTDSFHAQCDAAARTNLRRALGQPEPA